MSPNEAETDLPTRLLLVGLGGYGNIYLEEVLRLQSEGRVELVGGVEPMPAGCKEIARLRQDGVPVFDRLDAALAETRAELAVLSTPIQCHEAQVLACLDAGLHVLCEKPLAPTIEAAMRMRDAAARAPGFTAIGYQWSFSPPILELKRDILSGRLGAPVRFSSLVLWPRPEAYFGRNAWAGRVALDGAWVVDSPANNAMAHYLHNMLFLLGDSMRASALPTCVDSELYRANDIENYDTVALRCAFAGDVQALFFASHAIASNEGPRCVFEFERGRVELSARDGNRVEWRGLDGSVRDYGAIREYPDRGYFQKLHDCIDAARSGDASRLACTIETAIPHVVTVSAIQRGIRDIPSFDAQLLERIDSDGGPLRVVPGLQDALRACFEDARLPSEHPAGFDWARDARAQSIDDPGACAFTDDPTAA